MSDYRIVIDQSTSGTKALLFDTTRGVRLVDRLDKKHQQIYPQKGYVEQDPQEIVLNTKQLLEDLLGKHHLQPSDIQSISITNQRESVLVWDETTGQPYGNIMVWQCNRGQEICQELAEQGYEELVHQKTGLRLDPYFSASKLKWFFDHNLLSQEQKQTLKIGTMDTWLIWNLTAGAYYVTEPSNACRTLLYNYREEAWDEELCQLFSVPREALPQVIPSAGDFGSYLGIPIVSVLADSQAALYGHGAFRQGQVKMTLGTGSSILMNAGQNIEKDSSDNLLTTIAWSENGQTHYAVEGIIKSYGDILNWVRDQLGLFDSYQAGSDLAFKLKTNEGVYFIPALEGLTAPFWDAELHASFVGLSRNSNFIHLIRAAFEAMCYQTRAVLDEYRKNGYLISEIFVDGGSIRNVKFMQLLADITQTRLVVGEVEELSALGALLMGNQAIHYEPSIQRVYEPQRNYENEYAEWLGYVRKAMEE